MPWPEPIQRNFDYLTSFRESEDWEIHVTEIGYCHTKNLLKTWLREDSEMKERLKREVPLYIVNGQVWHRILTGWMNGEQSIDFMTHPEKPETQFIKVGNYNGQDISIIGTADWLEENGDPVIGELKTTRGLATVKKKGVSFQYELQGILYCKLYNINKMHWYFTDFYSEKIEIEEEYDDGTINEIWDWACNRATGLYRARVERRLIVKDVDFRDKDQGWQCAPYCPFTKYCHPDFPYHQKSHKGRQLNQQWRSSLIDPDVLSSILYDRGITIPEDNL